MQIKPSTTFFFLLNSSYMTITISNQDTDQMNISYFYCSVVNILVDAMQYLKIEIGNLLLHPRLSGGQTQNHFVVFRRKNNQLTALHCTWVRLYCDFVQYSTVRVSVESEFSWLRVADRIGRGKKISCFCYCIYISTNGFLFFFFSALLLRRSFH